MHENTRSADGADVPVLTLCYLHAGTGWDAIQEQIAKLEKRHAAHIAAYGEGNERRLTGAHSLTEETVHSRDCMGSAKAIFTSRWSALRRRRCLPHWPAGCETRIIRTVRPYASFLSAPGCQCTLRLCAQASTRRAAWRTSAGASPTAARPSASAAPCPSTSAATTRCAFFSFPVFLGFRDFTDAWASFWPHLPSCQPARHVSISACPFLPCHLAVCRHPCS